MQSSKRCLKGFEYFKSKLNPSGLLFLQETDTIIDSKKKMWKDEFGVELHFSHGSSNSCRVLIAFCGNQDITFKINLSNKKGRLLVFDERIDNSDFLLINIYNANTETEQVNAFNELSTILSTFENIHNHNAVFTGDFNVYFDASLDAKGGSPTLISESIGKMIE